MTKSLSLGLFSKEMFVRDAMIKNGNINTYLDPFQFSLPAEGLKNWDGRQ